MGKRIKVGEPVNAAEAWAFKFTFIKKDNKTVCKIRVEKVLDEVGPVFLNSPNKSRKKHTDEYYHRDGNRSYKLTGHSLITNLKLNHLNFLGYENDYEWK